jgi:predicted Rossmann fold flavoprotein
MIYDVAVIGGGAAGMMAAIRAAQGGARVILLEKNASLGRKLGLTGKGRCNVTNAADPEAFMAAFGKNGSFLRDAITSFSSQELIRFFGSCGVWLKTERQGRVFPETDSSQSIIDALKRSLEHQGVTVILSASVRRLAPEAEGAWRMDVVSGASTVARKVIVACGGASYPETGSTGDGFGIAKELGHTVTEIGPGLVPLETEEEGAKDLQGLTLKNIKVTFKSADQTLETPVGELLLTHFGISGPLVLDASAAVCRMLSQGAVRCFLDLKPGLTVEELEEKYIEEFAAPGPRMIKNYLTELLPERLIPLVLQQAGIDGDKKCHQVTATERRQLVSGLKAFVLTIRRPRPLSEAMVTQGGVSLKEIDPRTMASRLVPGVYFCGEVLDLAAASGGYNLQAAFSTGFVAGASAAEGRGGVAVSSSQKG